MKRILISFSVFLFLILLPLLLFSCSAGEEDYVYTETEDGYIITSVTGLYRNVELPASHNGKPVVAIADYVFQRNDTIRTLVIPRSVKIIGNCAFADCTSLKSVTFAAGGSCVINDGAFSGCTDLSELYLNSSVYSIGTRAFENCRKLGKVTLGVGVLNIGEDAFKNCEQIYIDAPEDSYAYTYAKTFHLNTSYIETDRPTYLLIVGAVVIGVIASVAVRFVDKKRAKARAGVKPEKDGASTQTEENNKK